MSALLELLAANALSAAILALLVLALGRRTRPAVSHALWAVVLLRLVMPPLVPLPLLSQDWQAALAASAGASALQAETAVPTADGHPRRARAPATGPTFAQPPTFAASRLVPNTPPGPSDVRVASSVATTASWTGSDLVSVGDALATLILMGGIAVLVLALRRLRRFARLTGGARRADAALHGEARELATQIGLPRTPSIWTASGVFPPLLWPARGELRILIPEALLIELTPAERRTLLAHELAHARRGDHRMRRLELLATALFWWYPLAWWTRRALRRAEERCCDEWVARVLPGSGRAYAQTLLKTASFLSGHTPALGLAATGMSPARDLRERLEEILMARPTSGLTRGVRAALLLTALCGLAVYPTWAERGPDEDAATSKRTDAEEGPPPLAPMAPMAPSAAPAPATPAAASAPAIPLAPPAPASDEATRLAPPVAPAAPLLPRAPRPLVAPVPAAPVAPLPRPVLAGGAPSILSPREVALGAIRAGQSQQELDLEEERLGLEREARDVERRRIELAGREIETQIEREREDLSREIQNARTGGNEEAAKALEASLARLDEVLGLEREQLALRAERLEELGGLELDIRRAQIETARLAATEQHEEQARRQEQIERQAQELERRHLEFERRAHELERRQMRAEMTRRQVEERLRLAQRARQSQQHEARLAREMARHEAAMEARARELEVREAEIEAHAREREAERLARAGALEAAAEARAAAEQTRRRVEAQRSAIMREHQARALQDLRTEIEEHLAAVDAARRDDRTEDVSRLERQIAALRAEVERLEAELTDSRGEN